MSSPFSAIVRREFSAYWSTPVAYVFLVVFLLLAGFFTFSFGGFFERGEASLASFFAWLPWLFLFIVPAIGMRLWADEQRLGTLELLMTLPITPWQAILGKFLAAWLFVAIALGLTFPLVITVNWLGDPDNGTILAGYLGALLVAGTFLAIASFCSALTRNQAIAFVLSLIACLLLILAGAPPVVDLLGRWAGPRLMEVIAAMSVLVRFDGFQRGLFDLRDVFYLGSIALLALFATSAAIATRRAASSSPVTVGIVAVVLVLANLLLVPVSLRIDLSQGRVNTLSDGSKAIVGKLEQPIKVRFYASSDENVPIALKAYARRVEDLLRSLRSASGGKLEIERLDPQPDSDAEDSAQLDGIEAQQLPNGERFYLGMVIGEGERKVVLATIGVDRERLLEYDLARAISRATAKAKPVIGVLSPLPAFGSRGMPQMGMPPSDKWVFISELERDFDVRRVATDTKEIDAEIKALLVIHPRGLSEQAAFAIDQFVLRGGRLIAFVDPKGYFDPMAAAMGMQGGTPSSLEPLLKTWGIEFKEDKVVADLRYLSGAGPRAMPAVLTLMDEALNPEEVATQGAGRLLIAFAGAFGGKPVDGLTRSVLLKSSPVSMLIDSAVATEPGERAVRGFQRSNTEQALAIKLTGRFPTAFPEGIKEGPEQRLSKATADATVVLIGDSDFVQDGAAVQIGEVFGQRVVVPANGNLAFAQALVEQMSGETDLVNARARAVLTRPVVRINEMEAQAAQEYIGRVGELEENLQQTQKKLQELQAKRGPNASTTLLSPEQQAELDEFRKRSAETRRELKNLRRELRADSEALQFNTRVINIALMPVLVVVFGLLMYAARRRRVVAI
jgi:ABC-type uncharacterized transport system involved in gliding motility auxiliary subunit/ABC-type transport system involved in multi-copper enzyme maturation permease subunit